MCLCPDSSASLSIFTGGLPAHGFVLALRNVFEVMNNIAVFHEITGLKRYLEWFPNL